MRLYPEQQKFFDVMPDCKPLGQLDGSSGAVIFIDTLNPYQTFMVILPNGSIQSLRQFFGLED